MNEADRQLDRARSIVAFHEALAARRKAQPAEFYKPNEGQEAFHRSLHVVRLLVPGNGFGKTRGMGTEAAWWLNHRHPFQPIPNRPILALWVPPDYQQFENVAKSLLEEECLSAGWTWNENKHKYTYPSGDSLYVYSHEKGWKSAQGSAWDLVLCDEQPPLMLWRELTMRRRGKRKTRFVIAATATEGESWMESELYEPWMKHHQERGLSDDQAMKEQSHPRYFVWPKGGIADNPAADLDDQAWYKERRWSSEAEKRVRLFGGFARFNGSPVFDQAAVDKLMSEMRARRDAGQGSRLGSIRLMTA